MQWWGHSKEHGWVVLDRSLPPNKPGIHSELLFFRCRDGAVVNVKREKWDPPAYIFAPNYLHRLGPDALAAATVELEALKIRWPEFKAEISRLYREASDRVEAARLDALREEWEAAIKHNRPQAVANHKRFLEGLGLADPGITQPATKKGRSAASCPSCSNPLKTSIEIRCLGCGRPVCDCGACGCARAA